MVELLVPNQVTRVRFPSPAPLQVSQVAEQRTAGMNTRHAGSCLCGEVRFEIEGEFESFYLCHCGYCRKDTGSAHAAYLFSSTAALKWVSGGDKVRQFNLPTTRHS